MKKTLHKLRVWLLKLLGVEPREHKKSNFLLVLEINSELRAQLGAYKTAMREVCRRSENTYYDWCCEYCAAPCDKRNGWCESFMPKVQDKM